MQKVYIISQSNIMGKIKITSQSSVTGKKIRFGKTGPMTRNSKI